LIVRPFVVSVVCIRVMDGLWTRKIHNNLK
jgi:hypothetical protein